MAIQLIDGAGTGSRALVGSDKLLGTRSITESREGFVSVEDGLSFFANSTDTANTLTATSTGGPMLYLRNDDSNRIIVIEKVLTSAAVAGGVVVWKANMTLGTIGNNNTHTPVNLNLSSSQTANATCYNWNESGDGMTGLSGGTKVKSFITGVGFTVHPIDGTIVLGVNDSFTIEYSNASGSEFECGVRFYFRSN